VFPDSSAIGKGEDPQWLYTVVFDGRELWAAEAQGKTSVSVDARRAPTFIGIEKPALWSSRTTSAKS